LVFSAIAPIPQLAKISIPKNFNSSNTVVSFDIKLKCHKYQNEPIIIALKNGLRFVNSLCKKPRQPYSSNTAYNVNEVQTIKP
jgi:hypothetical protein